MRQTAMLMFAAMLVTQTRAAAGAVVSVETMPPAVVETIPRAGDTQVDPALTEVRVTFSKDMQTDHMWSWCCDAPETFPAIDESGIRFLADRRTCVLPVTLKPEMTYVIWINSEKFKSFQDLQHHPAVPYLLVFTTSRSEAEAPDVAEQAALAAAKNWVALIDAGKYAESWETASSLVRNAVAKDQWIKTMHGAREPLGAKVARKLASKSHQTTLPGAPDGDYFVIQCTTSFANKQSATETITPMLEKDGVWRVSGYFIR